MFAADPPRLIRTDEGVSLVDAIVSVGRTTTSSIASPMMMTRALTT
jgi:hypothetical protein